MTPQYRSLLQRINEGGVFRTGHKYYCGICRAPDAPIRMAEVAGHFTWEPVAQSVLSDKFVARITDAGRVAMDAA